MYLCVGVPRILIFRVTSCNSHRLVYLTPNYLVIKFAISIMTRCKVAALFLSTDTLFLLMILETDYKNYAVVTPCYYGLPSNDSTNFLNRHYCFYFYIRNCLLFQRSSLYPKRYWCCHEIKLHRPTPFNR